MMPTRSYSTFFWQSNYVQLDAIERNGNVLGVFSRRSVTGDRETVLFIVDQGYPAPKTAEALCVSGAGLHQSPINC